MTQLEKFFKNLKASFFASAAIYLVTGMLLMIFPEQIAKVACYLFGGLFVLAGIYLVIKFFSCRSVSSLFSITLVSGIIIAAIGIFLMFKQDVVYSVIPFIFGIVAIIDGLINIQRAVMLARNHFPMWWLSLLFKLLCLRSALSVSALFSTVLWICGAHTALISLLKIQRTIMLSKQRRKRRTEKTNEFY